MIIGLGTDKDPNRLPLSTKKRNPIPNSQRKQKIPAVLNAARSQIEGISPDIKLRSLSSEYDCVGLIFASRRTAIGAENLQSILNDDGYRLVPDRQDVVRGDLVVYRKTDNGEINHVAIVWCKIHDILAGTIRFQCLSQWGEVGEYFHPEDIVSEWYGPHREFWSERALPQRS